MMLDLYNVESIAMLFLSTRLSKPTVLIAYSSYWGSFVQKYYSYGEQYYQIELL